MIDIALFLKKMKETNIVGCECKYVSLSDGTGVKIYCSQQKRDEVYQRQEKAYSLGFGPQVYEKLKLKAKGRIFYCYRTEEVEILADYADRNGLHYSYYEKDLDMLAEKAALHKFPRAMINDLADLNVGIKDGKFYIVDFGLGGTNSFDEEDVLEELYTLSKLNN